jgi:hypothetical protein
MQLHVIGLTRGRHESQARSLGAIEKSGVGTSQVLTTDQGVGARTETWGTGDRAGLAVLVGQAPKEEQTPQLDEVC